MEILNQIYCRYISATCANFYNDNGLVMCSVVVVYTITATNVKVYVYFYILMIDIAIKQILL